MIESNCRECGERVVKPGRTPAVYCSINCKAAWQRRAKPVSRAWLIERYIDEGLDCVQIGKLVSRDPKSVWNWLKDFGIPTRLRGSDPRPHFKPGQTGTFTGKRHTLETKEKIRQIAKADGRVPFDPAVGSYMKGRRGADTPNWKGGITAERQSFYTTPEWKDAVKAVWKRSNATCERCGLPYREVRTNQKFHIHHIVSFAARALRAEPSNLVLLCKDCHHFVHGKDNASRELIGEMPCL